MPALTPQLNAATPSLEPLLSVQDMNSRIFELQVVMNLNNRRVKIRLLEINESVWKNATHNSAQSQKNPLSFAIKTCSVGLGFLSTAALACPHDFLKAHLPQFIVQKATTPKELTKLLMTYPKPFQEGANVGASYIEAHTSSYRTEETMRGDIAHSTFEHATRRSAELDAEDQRILQMYQTMGDTIRASLNTLRDKR